MRTVDTAGLKCQGSDGLGPWRLGEDRLLRTTSMRVPLATPGQARLVYDSYRVAHDTGARTPEPFEVVRVGEGYGVVVEYVVGVPLATHVLLGSYGFEEAASEVGRLQRALHVGCTCGGIDFKARFAGWARAAAELVEPHEADAKLTRRGGP